MITLYTGVPGSGKTYRLVYELLKLPVGKYYIFHNIDGLQEELIEGGQFIQQWQEIKDFLTMDKQKQITEQVRDKYGRSCLVIIDEAWEWLGRKSKSEPEAIAWLKMHRHLSQQVWVCTQSYKDLSQAVYDIIPVEIRAKRGIASTQYIYQHNVRGEAFRTERIPKKKAVYLAYTSFQGTGEKQKGTKIGWLAVGAVVLCLFSTIYAFGPGLKGVFAGHKEASPIAKVSPSQSRSSSPVKRIAPPPPASVLLPEYSFAGCVGNRWLVQSVQGGALSYGDEVAPQYYVKSCDGSGVVLLTSTGEFKLRKKKIIGVANPKPPEEPKPPAGS